MNRAKMQQQTIIGVIAESTEKRRLSGYRLIIARAAWLAMVIPGLGITLLSFPVYYQQLLKPCTDDMTCNIPGAMTVLTLVTTGRTTEQIAYRLVDCHS